jgi:hypothetical protein
MAKERDLIEMIMWGGGYKEEEWQPYDIEGAKSKIDVKIKEIK